MSATASRRNKKQPKDKIDIPPAHDWRTTDADEVNRRRQRARDERFHLRNTDPSEPVFSRFQVKSGTGMTYSVEIRDIASRQFSCECVDFAANNLGTCKHIEAVLLQLEARLKKDFHAAVARGSDRIHIAPDLLKGVLRIVGKHRLGD